MADTRSLSPPTSARVPTRRDFWEARGRGCFWITKNIGYRTGALLAVPCHRLGLAPNTVTVLSFLTALAGVSIATSTWVENRIVQGLVLWIFLTISYGLDCADGTLARVTGQTSSFGLLWDKLLDMATLIVTTGMLGYAALNVPFGLMPVEWRPFLFFWSIAPRCILTTFMWLKESQVTGMSRLHAECCGGSTAWKIKRIVGNVIDEPSFHIGLALFWSLGFYWTFVLLYSTAISVVLALYVISTKRELDAKDAERTGPQGG
jgi:phosphatidylglycerophosphate synthase